MRKPIVSNNSLTASVKLRAHGEPVAYNVPRGLRCRFAGSDQEFNTISEVEKFVQEGPSQFNEDRYKCILEIRESNCGAISNELASADHFADARRKVSKSGLLGYASMLTLIGGYAYAKKELSESELELLGLKTGRCEIAPFTPEEVVSGLVGATQGLVDYLKSYDSPHARLSRGQPVRIDTLNKRARDYFESKYWG